MANALYDKGRQAFLSADIDWLGDNIKATLVDTAVYTVDLAADEFLTDLSGVVATSADLTGKTATDGVADADDVTFSAVSGASCEAIVLYQDTGVAATSRLIAYIDTATGLPVTPNGSDIQITWPVGSDRIFKL